MNKTDLYQYYYEAFNVKSNRVKKHTREAWNEKADKWKKELTAPDSTMSQVTRQRVAKSIEVLQKHQVLNPEATLIDIGCGPGRFVGGFAPYVKKAVGTDISNEMTEAGARYCKEIGAANTQFHVLDFKEVDLLEIGWHNNFDICFSFMSPAVSKYDTLQKMMTMSKKWCSSSFALGYDSRLDHEILDVLNPPEEAIRHEDEWFFNMFNLLWLEGYCPITDYYQIHAEEFLLPKEELIRHRIRRRIKGIEYSEEEIRKVLSHLQTLTKDGLFQEVTKNRYGNILWNVKEKREN